jgi:hypothetical protein
VDATNLTDFYRYVESPVVITLFLQVMTNVAAPIRGAKFLLTKPICGCTAYGQGRTCGKQDQPTQAARKSLGVTVIRCVPFPFTFTVAARPVTETLGRAIEDPTN